MKAVGLTRYLPIDDPASLQDLKLARPVPGAHDLLVRVEAVSVNPVDTKVRAPREAVEATPRVLGYDAAGVVEAVGSEVTLFQPGDEVYYAGDIGRPGSNAQYQLVDERIAGARPATLVAAGCRHRLAAADRSLGIRLRRRHRRPPAAGDRRRRRGRLERHPAGAACRLNRSGHRLARRKRGLVPTDGRLRVRRPPRP